MAYGSSIAGNVMGRQKSLLETLFPNNQAVAGFSNWTVPNSNFLLSLAAGLASGDSWGDGVAKGLQNAAQFGKPADDAYATAKKDEAQRRATLNQTVKWAVGMFPEMANMPPELVAQIAPKAYEGMLLKGGQQVDPSTTPDGRATLADQYGLSGEAKTQYVLTGKLPDAAKPPSVPTSYQEYQLAQQDPGYAARLNSTTSKPPTEAVRRNQQLASVMVPELQSLLGDGTNPGTFAAMADLANQAKSVIPGGNLFGPTATSPEYQQAQDSLKTIVASYLYSVSGATANPGEVQNQVDVLTPKPGDSPQRLLAKKARVQQMVQAVVEAAQTGMSDGSSAPSAWSANGSNGSGGYTILGVE